jgi:hypothetical protein
MPNDQVQPFNGTKLPQRVPAHVVPGAPSRSELFRQAAKKLRLDFQERQQAHNVNDASGALRDFLAAHLPRRFGLGEGYLVDAAEQTSPFCSALIYDTLNCPDYPAEDGSIFPCDGVSAVIDVCPRLGAAELRAAFDRIARLKALRRSSGPDPLLGRGAIRPLLGAVFAPAAGVPFDALIQEYTRSLRERDSGVQVDLIGVGEIGILLPHASRYGSPTWYPLFASDIEAMRSEGMHLAAGGLELGEYALDGFFRFLLAHLMATRPTPPYAAFDWLKTEVNLELLLQYVASFTDEPDPFRRAELLERYRADAMQSMGL